MICCFYCGCAFCWRASPAVYAQVFGSVVHHWSELAHVWPGMGVQQSSHYCRRWRIGPLLRVMTSVMTALVFLLSHLITISLVPSSQVVSLWFTLLGVTAYFAGGDRHWPLLNHWDMNLLGFIDICWISSYYCFVTGPPCGLWELCEISVILWTWFHGKIKYLVYLLVCFSLNISPFCFNSHITCTWIINSSEIIFFCLTLNWCWAKMCLSSI